MHRPLTAFHGTRFENLHGILACGLLAASGSELQRNGALFGSGAYLSTDLGTAFSFSAPASAWAGSALGARLRCVLVCQVCQQLSPKCKFPTFF
jgi:poly[ADP-ribose] polymerase 16